MYLRVFIIPILYVTEMPYLLIYLPIELGENLKGKQNVIHLRSIIFPGNLCNICF